jgi:Major Facilitator Superfamily
MAQATTDPAHASPGSPASGARARWSVLAVVGLAQLMLQFNSNVIVIALPSAQHGLAVPDDMRAWVLGIYSLAFGGMLMAGGRVVDRIGRKRAIVGAMAGFVIASAIGGAAPDATVLIAALALQGVFAAVQNPAQPATLSTTFTDAKQRAKATPARRAGSSAPAGRWAPPSGSPCSTRSPRSPRGPPATRAPARPSCTVTTWRPDGPRHHSRSARWWAHSCSTRRNPRRPRGATEPLPPRRTNRAYGPRSPAGGGGRHLSVVPGSPLRDSW